MIGDWLQSLEVTDAMAAVGLAAAGYCLRFLVERRRDRDLEKFKHLLNRTSTAHNNLLQQRADAIKVVYTSLTSYMAALPVKVGRMRDIQGPEEHRLAKREVREMGIDLSRTFQVNLIYFTDEEIGLIQDVLDGIKGVEERCLALPLHGDPQRDTQIQAEMADFLKQTWVPAQLTLMNQFRRILGVASM